MVVLETLQVSPRDIRFTQDSIAESFGDHRGEPALVDRESIEDTFRKLLYGDVTVNSIRTISAVRKDNQVWVVSGNRRLYVYKKLQEFGRINTIPVNIVALNKERFEKMFTTKNEGTRIYIRQDRKRPRGQKLEDRLRIIYNKWVSHGQPMDGYPSDVVDHGYFGGSTWAPAAPSPRSYYVEPVRTVTPPRPQPPPQPRPQPTPYREPPARKDDSWCTII